MSRWEGAFRGAVQGVLDATEPLASRGKNMILSSNPLLLVCNYLSSNLDKVRYEAGEAHVAKSGSV
jgi:hypothetical protein